MKQIGPSHVQLAGRTVQRVGLGTMHLVGASAYGPPDDLRQTQDVLRTALRWGVRLFDTADAYGPGIAEAIIAETLHPYPKDMVLATKGGIERRGRDEWIPNGRPDHIRSACEASLRRLRLEALPLYQLHTVDPEVPIEDSMGAMADLQAEGKVEHTGLCNVSVSQLQRAAKVIRISSVQDRYNRVDRSHEDVLTYCGQHGIPFIAWTPLDGGRLAQVSRDDTSEDEPAATLEIRWLLRQSPAMCVIPGASTVEELLEDLAALS